MNIGIVRFPGSNCDRDAYIACEAIDGIQPRYLWHQDSDIRDLDAVIIPGGFSYGDYLRTGAFARFSPIMKAVGDFANKGGLVLGICNGFQILLESGLLGGAMLPNAKLRFICDTVELVVANTNTPFTNMLPTNKTIKIPIAHFEGNFFSTPEALKKLKDNDRIVFEYKNNPNGSVANIAGIANETNNVLGMMPHPERAFDRILGSDDGKAIFLSMLNWINNKTP
jgi:phosphoribosylformylglycinamidine synthase subunit PurQ / glutaminase